MKFHPDRNPDDANAEKRFKEASEAAEVLLDQEKRQAYDQFGHAAVDGSSGEVDLVGSAVLEVLALFLRTYSAIYLGDPAEPVREGPSRGSDLRYVLTLDLEEAVRGCNPNIKIPTLVQCDECKGYRCEKGTSPIDCVQCGGLGQVSARQGIFSIQQTCPRCRGQGKIISDPCSVLPRTRQGRGTKNTFS